MHSSKKILNLHFMLVFKNSGVFRKVGTVPNLFWCLEAFLRGVYFWVFEPSLHLFYLIKKHISLNYSIKRRVSTLLRLKIVVLYRTSILKAVCSLDTILLFNSKAFLVIWLWPSSNRWPYACEHEMLYNELIFCKIIRSLYSISHLHAGGHRFEPWRLQLRKRTKAPSGNI